MTEALHRLARVLVEVQEALPSRSNILATPEPGGWSMPVNPSFVTTCRDAQPARDSGSTNWEAEYGTHITPPLSPDMSQQTCEIKNGNESSPALAQPAFTDTLSESSPTIPAAEPAVTASVPDTDIAAGLTATQATISDVPTSDITPSAIAVGDSSGARVLFNVPPELRWYAVIVRQDPGVYQGSHRITANTIGIPGAIAGRFDYRPQAQDAYDDALKMGHVVKVEINRVILRPGM
ncbi:hypothetical protein H0H81_002762 [Sphagnurus paluster]|uniref:Uncharacterized protein n=1 Tax=Sphagnurus paluster TaxID=117069 RepID=A0A9P7FM11_9AGAR|nr:hypothetical protein H0H81_002762 [Sphagnurus paluster]